MLVTDRGGKQKKSVHKKKKKQKPSWEDKSLSGFLFLNTLLQKPTGVQCTQSAFSAGRSTAAAAQRTPPRHRSCASSGPLRARICPEIAHRNQECSLAPCKAMRVCISDTRAMNDRTAAALSAPPSMYGCGLSSAPLHSKLCSENTLEQEVSYHAIMHKTA